MNRRKFITSTGAAGLFAARGFNPAPATAQTPVKRSLMKLGTRPLPPRNPPEIPGALQRTEYLRLSPDRRRSHLRHRRRTEPHGRPRLQMRHQRRLHRAPLPGVSYIDREKHPAIMMAQSPERDRDIESLQTMIKNCAQAGIPSIKYNMSILGVVRSGRTPGRGDAMYSTWKLSETHPETPLTKAGPVNADQFWERITYFLDRVIPVANEYKIRMACHPHDPGMPPEGYQGVNRVLGTVDGLKKFVCHSGERLSRAEFLPGDNI